MKIAKNVSFRFFGTKIQIIIIRKNETFYGDFQILLNTEMYFQTYTENGPIWVMIQMSKNKTLARTTHVGTHPCPPESGWEILSKRSILDDVLDVFVPISQFRGFCLDRK